MSQENTPPPGGYLAAELEQLTAERGWSMRELARRSDLPPATVHKITWPGAVTVPKADTLEALARGLGVPVTLLLDAAAKDRGLKVVEVDEGDPSILITVKAMQELPPERRREIAALAKAMLATRDT